MFVISEGDILFSKAFVFLSFTFMVMVNSGNAYSQYEGELNVDGGYEEVFMPRMSANSIIIDDDDIPPSGPVLAKAKFIKYPPVSGVYERIERMVYGIKMDIRPELDHYGYEIRRYMAKVGDMEIFSNNEFLNEQIINTRKAGIIADYWKKHLEKEISEIEKIIEDNDSIELRYRTVFKQNKVAVQTFLIILKSWIDANQRVLEAVKKEPDIYEVRYPEIEIVVPTSRVNFFNLYSKRQAKLKDLRKYQPFAMMVY